MNFINRRALAENVSIPGMWDSLWLDIEELARDFDVRYAIRQGDEVECYRKANSAHVAVIPGGTGRRRAIEICCEPITRRLCSCIEGEDCDSLRLDVTDDGNTFVVDEAGSRLTNDQALRRLLEPFFVPPRKLKP